MLSRNNLPCNARINCVASLRSCLINISADKTNTRCDFIGSGCSDTIMHGACLKIAFSILGYQNRCTQTRRLNFCSQRRKFCLDGATCEGRSPSTKDNTPHAPLYWIHVFIIVNFKRVLNLCRDEGVIRNVTGSNCDDTVSHI